MKGRGVMLLILCVAKSGLEGKRKGLCSCADEQVRREHECENLQKKTDYRELSRDFDLKLKLNHR